jgi:hypothetical protein
MHRRFKSVYALVLSGLLLGFWVTPASAFRMSVPSSTSTVSKNLAAFNGDVSSDKASYDFLLSPSEMEHIRWCAAQYRSYHAVDNTISDRSGHRTACVSPVD